MRRNPPAGGLEGFFERVGDEAAEVAWEAALAWAERSVRDARAGNFGRFRWYPSGELRRLRRDLAHALELARFAVALQEEENDVLRALTRQAREALEEAEKARRRNGTREAERVRLEKAARKRQGST